MKKNGLWVYGLALASALASAPAARADVYADFESSMKTMCDLYRSQYGLADWKKEKFDWKIDRECERVTAEGLADPNLSVASAQALMNRFVQSSRDYHGHAYDFEYATETLPIWIRVAGARAFVGWIDSEACQCNVQVGDEVLRYDGQTIADAVADLRSPYLNLPAADLRDTELRFGRRYLWIFDPAPRSSTYVLKIKAKDGKVADVNFTWVAEAKAKASRNPIRMPTHRSVPTNLIGFSADPNPHDYGPYRSFLPRPSTVTWSSADDAGFDAFIGATAKGTRVGMIRIASFYPAGDEAGFKAYVDEFAGLIDRMSGSTDVLLIDLIGNRGGVADYMHALVSYLATRPIATPTYQYRLFKGLVQSMAVEAAQISKFQSDADAKAYFGDTYFGYPVDLAFARSVQAFLTANVKDAAKGMKIGKAHYYDIPEIKPAAGTRYTKPIIVLTDAWTASEGDAFAAVLQDSGRATIAGERTAGAGAFVGGINYAPTPLGVDYFAIPIALAHRKGGAVIENNGVVPDARIGLVPADFGDGYSDFGKKVYDLVDARADR